MLKLSLVYPRRGYRSGDPPLGICQLAAWCETNPAVRVTVIDTTFHRDPDRVFRELRASQPHLIGIYAESLEFGNTLRILAGIRRQDSGIPTLCGGPHATILPETLAAHCDLVIAGEGEPALAAVCGQYPSLDPARIPGVRFAYGEPVAAPGVPVVDLDRLPAPDLGKVDLPAYRRRWNYLDAIDPRLDGTNLTVSRGCPYSCTYCQPTLRRLFGPRLRHRHPELVLADMCGYATACGLHNFYFHDDTFTADRAWVVQFARACRRANRGFRWGANVRADTVDRELLSDLHAAGLRVIHLGIESACQHILDDAYGKGLTVEQITRAAETAHACGIRVMGFFMLGAPEETAADLRATVAAALRLPLTEATFNIATPLPGTTLHQRVRDTAPQALHGDYSSYDYYRGGAYRHPLLTGAQLRRRQLFALLQFYLHPRRWSYLARHFTSRRGLHKLLAKAGRFAA